MNTEITLTRSQPQEGMIPIYTIKWQENHRLRDYPTTCTQQENPWVAFHLIEDLMRDGYTPCPQEMYQTLLKDKDLYITWWNAERAFEDFDLTDNPNDGLEDHDRIPGLDDCPL